MSKATGLTKIQREYRYVLQEVLRTRDESSQPRPLTPKQMRRIKKKANARPAREAARANPVNHRCDHCKSAPGQTCRTSEGHPARKTHKARGI